MAHLDHHFFNENRQKILRALKGGLLVLPAYSQMQRGNDAAFKFEQEANFWYATGIDHPDWWIIIDGIRGRSWLVSPDIDEVHALFDGSLSRQDAATISGINDVLSRQEADDLLKQSARTHKFVYTLGRPARHDNFDFTMNPAAREMNERLSRLFEKVQDFRSDLEKIRAIKSDDELASMQAAIDLTSSAFETVKSSLLSYKYEYEIEAQFSYEFRKVGAAGHAYDPIIASAGNACTLHSSDNQSALKKGTLVLMDIGARSEGYAADITRTYSYGKATKRQRDVHAAVRSAQQEIIELLSPGLSVHEYHDQVDMIMKNALMELGLIESLSDEEAYRQYFPHAISHGLGIDVHDALGAPTQFQSGMVLTVEPGIYIPEEGIGVRIEDDILITDSGYRNMSVKLSTEL